jgi:hypothetical protein
MIRKLGKPISGGAGQFRPTPNVLTRANQTSLDAQNLARASATPFQSRQGPVNIPVRSLDTSKLGIPYTVAKPVNARPQNLGSQPMSQSAMFAAVGEPRAPKGYNSINSGFPQRGFVRSTGSSSQPFAKGRKG